MCDSEQPVSTLYPPDWRGTTTTSLSILVLIVQRATEGFSSLCLSLLEIRLLFRMGGNVPLILTPTPPNRAQLVSGFCSSSFTGLFSVFDETTVKVNPQGLWLLNVCLLTFTEVQIQAWEHNRSKHITFSCPDFTASSDSDKVLSAGDRGYNLLNTTVSEDLSNKSTKSTQPRRFTFFLSPSLFLVIIFSEWDPTLRKCYAFQTVCRGWLHGYPLASRLIYFPSLCLKPPCEGKGGTLDCEGPPFVSFLSRILHKSQAIRIRSVGFYSLCQTHPHH